MGVFGQNQIDLDAFVDIDKKELRINQTITYRNTTQDTLYDIYLNDWSNSYSNKNTALAKRFAEEFSNRFHFAKDEERGYTVITSLKDCLGSQIKFERLAKQPDIIKVYLQEPLLPNASYNITLNYIVKVPTDLFTRYGVTNNLEYNLKNWYITPAIYNGKWQYYSNKDLDDLYAPPSTLNFNIEIPKNYYLTSELNEVSTIQQRVNKTIKLSGNNRMDSKLFINKLPNFKNVETDYFTIVTDIDDEGLEKIEKAIIADRIAEFITSNLGEYPHEKLLLSEVEYRKNPIYGLNLLPDFIKPYPNSFQYELKLLKTALRNYLSNVTHFNPRKDYWLIDALQIYYLMKYVEQCYPDTKLLGKLSNIWGIKSFHAAKLNFNAQYYLLFMTLGRANLDQPLSMQKDSLLKFNENIAGKYKAGMGLNYLDDYINENTLENTIKTFVAKNQFKPTSTEAFRALLRSKTDKNLSWFFDDYVKTNKKIDYTISKITNYGDSIKIKIKNKTNSKFPITLFTVDENDSIDSKLWINGFKKDSTVTIAKSNFERVVLNYDHNIPEINPRDNTKPLKSKLFNKPIRLRLIKDVEDSNYNQVFLMPIIEYRNIYDGLRLGTKIYNKPFLKKNFLYRVAPQYATNSNALTGSMVLEYHSYSNNNKSNLYKTYYGFGASYSSFAEGLFVRKFSPTLSFQFRNRSNLRSNKRQFLNFRFVDIQRDEDILNVVNVSEPNYSVFNIR